MNQRLGRRVLALTAAVSISLLMPAVASAATASGASFAALSLVNGWTGAPFSTALPSASVSSGVVTLAGGIASGSSPTAFTLPPGFRPATDVYVPVDLCNATNGRLHITPAGVVDVQTASFANAQCFTSLEGASFAMSAKGYTAMSLQNGWTGSPFSTSAPAAKVISGVVHLKGAMTTSGTNAVAFTLPTAMRPATDVYIKVDLCNATDGRLHITPAGVVDVEAGTFANAQCFTSLDGSSFVLGSATALTLQNGWTGSPFSTSAPAAVNIGGVVHLKGAMATSGTNATAFTLPAAMRPATEVYVPVDLCNATNGRLVISPSGSVDVQAETSFANAQCFTSLDGALFDL